MAGSRKRRMLFVALGPSGQFDHNHVQKGSLTRYFNEGRELKACMINADLPSSEGCRKGYRLLLFEGPQVSSREGAVNWAPGAGRLPGSTYLHHPRPCQVAPHLCFVQVHHDTLKHVCVRLSPGRLRSCSQAGSGSRPLCTLPPFHLT